VKDDNVTLISPYFRVINNSSSDEIYLQHVKIRYYFTLDSSDSEETMNYEIYYAGKSNIDGTGAVEDIKPNTIVKIAKMDIPTDMADHYLEIGFDESCGTIGPDKKVEVMVSISKEKYKKFIQTNDYSYNDSAENYVSWEKVTLYLDDELISGIEPNMYASRETGAWYMF